VESRKIYTEYLMIKNSHAQQQRLHIEPWAEELAISTNTTYQIVAEGPLSGCLEVEIAEGTITVYGWPGSVLTVFHGKKALCECSTPAPPLPELKSGTD